MSTTITRSSPPPQSSPSTRIFHQFSLLPLELQRKIWRSHFPPSRTINFSYNICPSEALLSAPPITLHICAESRAETLLHYTLIYRSEFPGCRGKTGGNCGILLSKAMRQPICFNPRVDVVGFHAMDLCAPEKGRRRFAEWVKFLEMMDERVMKGRVIELIGLDWDNSMYTHLKYQEGLRCKGIGEEYDGQGGSEVWEELNYGGLLRWRGLREVWCGYAHKEYMGNFEEQLERFLRFHAEIWGQGVPRVRRLV